MKLHPTVCWVVMCDTGKMSALRFHRQPKHDTVLDRPVLPEEEATHHVPKLVWQLHQQRGLRKEDELMLRQRTDEIVATPKPFCQQQHHANARPHPWYSVCSLLGAGALAGSHLSQQSRVEPPGVAAGRPRVGGGASWSRSERAESVSE